MKWKMKIATKCSASLALFGLTMFSCNVFADKVPEQTNASHKRYKPLIFKGRHKVKMHKSQEGWSLGEGWLLNSTGGLSYVHPTDPSYWCKISGVIRLDETIFMGSYRDKQGDFPSGANLRKTDLYLDGGVGKDWEYTISLEFNGGNRFSFSDTWIAYAGFMDNNQVFVGRVPGNWFGLDNANSTTWLPFLERSLATSAFYPGDGLGAMTDFWWDWGAFTITAMQYDHGAVSSTDAIAGNRDRWRGTARATVAPVHEQGNVWHFGVSGAYREVISTVSGVGPGEGVAFSTTPSARTRNTATTLINTTTGNGNTPIRANNVRLFNLEAARQYGPFMLEAEYTDVFVHRIGSNFGSLRFNGWMLQSRYLLTGESHDYDVRDGSFGAITPAGRYGAFEVAARYDFVNLNDKDVRGGAEHNVTVGLNWFINQQLRLSANYIRAAIYPANDAAKRYLDIIGMRAQIRFK